MRILADRGTEIGSHIGQLLLALRPRWGSRRLMLPISLVYDVRAGTVVVCALVLQLALQIIVQNCDIGSRNACIRSIVARVLAGCVEIDSLKPHVVASQRSPV